jgi:hypothetical protein
MLENAVRWERLAWGNDRAGQDSRPGRRIRHGLLRRLESGEV